MASSIPGAMGYWINLATTTLAASPASASPDGSKPYVWFGAPLGRFIAPVTLQITGAHEIIHQWAELGVFYKIEESYKIRNILTSFAGGLDFQGRMTEVFSNFQLLTVALAADYTLGNNVRLSLPMVDGEYIPGADPSGKTLGSLIFDIHCEARISSLT